MGLFLVLLMGSGVGTPGRNRPFQGEDEQGAEESVINGGQLTDIVQEGTGGTSETSSPQQAVALTPDNVLANFYRAYIAHDWDEMKRWAAPEMHGGITYIANLLAREDTEAEIYVTSYQVNNMIWVGDKNIHLDVTHFMNDNTQEEAELTMVEIDGQWLVSSMY